MQKFDPTSPPPPLLVSEPGSFAYKTLTTRKPAVIRQVLADYEGDYPPRIVAQVKALLNEITLNKPVEPLQTTAPDGPSWQAAWQAHRGRGWLALPWYFAEAFLYRRLTEAVNYFGSNPNLRAWQGVDPFLPRKQAELQSKTPWLVLSAALAQAQENSEDSFRTLLHFCVWGNRLDLSYEQVAKAGSREIEVATEQENLLADDTERVVGYLEQRRGGVEAQGSSGAGGQGGQIDFICDNAGTELLTDLALADFLLQHEWVQRIVLHVKAHPTFVSDAIPADVEMTIAAVKTMAIKSMGADQDLIPAEAAEPFRPLAARLQTFILQGRLRIRAHLFWNSSKFFWEMPGRLQTDLACSHLVIIKGDANYRRLLGDSRWPTTTPIADAAPYFPAPFVALRTMKSDPIVGLQPGQAEALDQEDAEWRVNGKRGMIQALLLK